MEFSMTEQEKGDLLLQGDCLTEASTWAGLTVYKNKSKNLIRTDKFKFSFRGLK